MAKKQLTIGIDIGGTKMAAVLFDGERVLMDFSLATPKDDLKHMLVMIKALIEPLVEKAKEMKAKVQGVGIGIAGIIDYKEGKVIESPNIVYINGIKLGEKIEKFVDYPVKIDNDGNCFLRAEMALGSAKKFKNVYGFVIGTGIGGAWWYNDDIYRTAHGGSGEPGQMFVDFSDRTMLEDAYHKLTQNNPGNMAEEAFRGDVLAVKSFEEMGEMLGLAFANVINILAPEVIVIGGGVVESSELFLSAAKKTMRLNIVSPELRKRTKVLKSKIGAEAGAIGAALLV